ncbi:hypothetical protein PENTCL1PPCAC_19439, partial [Pristionchus entomophagus]
YLLDFAERFSELPRFCGSFSVDIFDRSVLSGMVLFRVEVLPIFRQTIDDYNIMDLFVSRLLHFEGLLKRKLSEQTGNEDLSVAILFLSERIKRDHQWWNVEYFDNDNIN